MARVSIVIPVYNGEQYIAQAINSVLVQTFSDYEIIVVDDGSVDRIRELVLAFGSNVRYFYQQNAGVSAARNTGIAQAKGEYTAFLDADDVWDPVKLETQVGFLEQRPDFSVVGCNFQYMDVAGNALRTFSMRRLYPRDGFNLVNLLKYGVVTPSSIVMRTSVIHDCGLFDSRFDGAEDMEYFLRVLNQYSFGIVDRVLLRYRIGHASMSSGFHSYKIREKVLDHFFQNRLEDSRFDIRNVRRTAHYRLYYNHGKDLLWTGQICQARKYFARALVYKKTAAAAGLYVKSYLKDFLMQMGLIRKDTDTG